MSGIAGVLRFDGGNVDVSNVQAMISTMARRGPDGTAFWHQGACALGHCMLRTTLESLEENQPLANETGKLVLVMDGRVDNWEDLRRDLLLRGAVLRAAPAPHRCACARPRRAATGRGAGLPSCRRARP